MNVSARHYHDEIRSEMSNLQILLKDQIQLNREMLQMIAENKNQLSVLANATQTTDAKVSHLMIESTSVESSPSNARKRTRFSYPTESIEVVEDFVTISNSAAVDSEETTALLMNDVTPQVRTASIFATSNESSRRKIVEPFKTTNLKLKGMSIECMLLLYFKHDLTNDINWAYPVNATARRDMRRIANEALQIATEEQKKLIREPYPDASKTPDLFRTYEENMKKLVGDLKVAIMEKVKAYKAALMCIENVNERQLHPTRALPPTKPFVSAVATILFKAEKHSILK